MESQGAMPATGRRPGWGLSLLWFVASVAGAVIYFLPVGAVWYVFGLERLGDPQSAATAGVGLQLLGSTLCGAACGSTIGLGQALVMRRQLRRLGPWVLATMAGYGSLGLLMLLGTVLQPGWLAWATTLVANGKFHWLARELGEWPLSSWPAGALTLTLFGGVLGLAQWPVLRRTARHAGWWVAINAAGWALLTLLYLPDLGTFAPATAFFFPYAIAAVGLVWLLRHPGTAGA